MNYPIIKNNTMSFENTVLEPTPYGAVFSSCRKYRYVLWRVWDKHKPMAVFIGLNPSTANETTNDPTITHIAKIVKSWNYGGFYMLNLFAIISPDPEVLTLRSIDLQGDNEKWMELVTQRSSKIIFAWGAFKEAKARAKIITERFPDAEVLGFNNDGSPWHPLFKPVTSPIKFSQGLF
jgi:hypothetical protein